MNRGLIGLVILSLGAPIGVGADPPSRESVRSFEQHVRGIIDAAEPSVVSIVVSHDTKYPSNSKSNRPGRLGRYPKTSELTPRQNWLPFPAGFDPRLDLSDPLNVADHHFGTGIVLGGEGLILTNYHLIDGATKVYVRASTGKGSYADIHAADARSDLAVLQLLDPIPGLKPLKMAEVRVSDVPGGAKANVVRGSWVIALGHPHAAGVGDGSASASWGILSSVRRKAPGPGREELRTRALYHYSILLETDARITAGCSGGVILNLDGDAIGLITPLAAVTGSETAGGFAVPFDANYRRIIDVLRSGREVEYGFLGVSVDPAGPQRVEGGLKIKVVSPHTPAALVGLSGRDNGGTDALVAIDGKPIREQDDLFLLIGAALAGTRVTLTVARGGRTEQIQVTLAKSLNEMPWIASDRPPSVHGLRVDYGSILLLQNIGIPRRIEPVIPPGVLVREVEPNSPAEAWFKKLGGGTGRWVVTHVNDKQVLTPAEFYREAAGSREGVNLRLVDPNAPGTEHQIRLPDAPPPDRRP